MPLVRSVSPLFVTKMVTSTPLEAGYFVLMKFLVDENYLKVGNPTDWTRSLSILAFLNVYLIKNSHVIIREHFFLYLYLLLVDT